MEELNFVHDDMDNKKEIVDEKAHSTSSKSGAERKNNAGLLKAGIALMFASSVVSLGATTYNALTRDKKNDDVKEQHSTIGTVSQSDTVSVSEDGFWIINGDKTQFKAEGQDGQDGLDGKDAIFVQQAKLMYGDKWNISSYIMFVMNDGSYITTNTMTNVMQDYYYEATSAEDIVVLTQHYGVTRIRLAEDVNLDERLIVDSRLTIDLDGYELTYSASSPISVLDDARLVIENGDLVFSSDKSINLSGQGSEIKIRETNIVASAHVVEVIGENAGVKIIDSNIETVAVAPSGYNAGSAVSGSILKVNGANANIEFKATSLSTTLNVINVGEFARAIKVNVKDSDIVSTAYFMNVDTSVVVPSVTLDYDTMVGAVLAGFSETPIVSGEYNFNPVDIDEIGECESFNVNGKWVVAENLAELIEKVADGAIISLEGNIELETAIVIDKAITLNLCGCRISLPTDTAGDGVFRIVEGGNLVINGEGEINGVGNNNYNMAIWVNGGSCTINGGTYTNIGAVDKDDPNGHFDVVYVKGGSLTINGGKFFGQTPEWIVNTNDDYRDRSTIVINGGEFHGFNPANNATEGAGTNYVANGNIVVEKDGVYTIEKSLSDAVADTSVDSITLAGNFDLDECLRVRHTLTLDLNGFNIIRPNNASTQTILVYSGGDITINGEGIVDGDGLSPANDICVWAYGGKATINGGTYTNITSTLNAGDHVIYASHGGSVVINDGEFIGDNLRYMLNLQDNSGSSILIKGGIYHNFNPANNLAEGKHTNFVSDGYKVIEAKDVYTVVPAAGNVYVSTVETFMAALENKDVKSITLAKDLDFVTAVEISREITIELNHKKLTITKDTVGDGVFRIVEGGNLVINGEGEINGVGNNNYNMAIWVKGGSCTINGGTYTNIGAVDKDDPNGHFDVVYVKGGSLTINGGEFFGQTPAWLVNTNDDYREDSTIAIKGGVFHGFNPANNATEGAGTNYVAEGYKVVEADNVFTVVEAE